MAHDKEKTQGKRLITLAQKNARQTREFVGRVFLGTRQSIFPINIPNK
jgi:hypothetical protein